MQSGWWCIARPGTRKSRRTWEGEGLVDGEVIGPDETGGDWPWTSAREAAWAQAPVSARDSAGNDVIWGTLKGGLEGQV